MSNIPPYVSISFMACVLACFGFVYYAVDRASAKGSNLPVIMTTFVGIWIFIITLLTIQGFFLDFISRPPRLFMFFGIIVLIAIGLLSIKRSRVFIAKMPITTLTYIHIIRVPVEIVLWWLFMNGVVAESMTFQGLNYDILSGISAPFAGLFLVGMKSKSKFAAVIWNVLTMALLVNIVFRAIQATPYFYDVSLYDQPNIAVFYFPYILLPLFIVPAIVFCHIASLYKLMFIPDEPED